MIVKTYLDVSIDRSNWTVAAAMDGQYDYSDMLAIARPVLAYYNATGFTCYMRLRYASTDAASVTFTIPASSALTISADSVVTPGYGELTPLTEQDASAAIAEAERIIQGMA